MFSATLFDYNGVLVDDEAFHLEAFRDTLGPLGISLSDADYQEKYLGFDDAGAFEAVLRDVGRRPDASLIETLIEAKKPHYLGRAEASLVGFPGAAALLLRQASVGPVVIVSGALRDEIELGLRVLGVREAVSGIVSAEDTRRGKPDPDGYLQGLGLLRAQGVSAPEASTFVIEDSLSGIEAAKSAELPCLAVGHSYAETALRAAGADSFVARIDQVDDGVLRRLFEATRG